MADTAHKLTEFGRQNVQAYAELSQRLGTSYYNELDRFAASALKAKAAAAKVETVVRPPRKVAAKAARSAKRAAPRS